MSDYLPDPQSHPELFAQILPRRVLAAFIDFLTVVLFSIALSILLFIAGFLSLSLTWWFIPLAYPITVICYYTYFLGGPDNATPGMRACDIILTQTGNKPIDKWRGLAHMILRHISVIMLSPLILLVGIFTRRKQLLHDFAVEGLMIRRSPLGR